MWHEELMELSILNHIIQPLLEKRLRARVGLSPACTASRWRANTTGRTAVVFTVRDDGAGIPAERLVKIRESLETEGAQENFSPCRMSTAASRCFTARTVA
jgi:signal transduction histidine kinase